MFEEVIMSLAEPVKPQATTDNASISTDSPDPLQPTETLPVDPEALKAVEEQEKAAELIQVCLQCENLKL